MTSLNASPTLYPIAASCPLEPCSTHSKLWPFLEQAYLVLASETLHSLLTVPETSCPFILLKLAPFHDWISAFLSLHSELDLSTVPMTLRGHCSYFPGSLPLLIKMSIFIHVWSNFSARIEGRYALSH